MNVLLPRKGARMSIRNDCDFNSGILYSMRCHPRLLNMSGYILTLTQ